MSSAFAATLARILRQRYIAEIDVARELGVSPSLVARWLTGDASPSSEDVARLEQLLSGADALALRSAAVWPASTGRDNLPETPGRALSVTERELLARVPPAFRAAFAAAFAKL
jgi:transcriptional regulator with XRE-family HTH domain